MSDRVQRIDLLTVIGLGLLLMPLTTMWHEIGGHAVACAVQGGRLAAVSAFYVVCEGLGRRANILVAIAGVAVDTVAAVVLHQLWRRVRGDLARLVLWLAWADKAMVAAGYFLFSGVTGLGDLGPGEGGGIGPLPQPELWRAAEAVLGGVAYFLIVRAAIRMLTAMLGDAPASRPARQRIAHGYYLASGCASVLVGLLNPMGLFITLASAAAASLGGLAGLISVGFAVPRGDEQRAFVVERSWPVIVAGVLMAVAFAVVLGPTVSS